MSGGVFIGWAVFIAALIAGVYLRQGSKNLADAKRLLIGKVPFKMKLALVLMWPRYDFN